MAPSQAQRPAPSGTITIDAASRGPAVPPDLYGVFFEEISHAGEGGLYAELIQNRGFEDSRLPPMCKLENGFLIPPRTAHFDTGKPSDFKLRWNVTSETPAWTLNATGDAAATMNLVDEMPLTPATPRSLRVDVTALPTGGRAALNNEGFWGIQRRQGRCWSYIPETGGGDFTVSLKARKISGKASSFHSVSPMDVVCNGMSVAGAIDSTPCRSQTRSSASRHRERSRPAAGTT